MEDNWPKRKMIESEWTKIGEIGVDAGLCWVGDPCYIHHDGGKNKPDEFGKDWEEFISLPHKAMKRDVKESESNKFFVKETLKIIGEHPFLWLKLIFGKTFSVLTGRDFLRTEDVYFYDNYISATLFRAISTKLIFILAVVGIILSFKDARKFLLLYAILFSEMFIIFFQIKTRYLMPIIPFIIVFSAYSVYCLYDSLKNKKSALAVFIVFLIAILNLVSFLNPLKITTPSVAETYFAIAKNYQAWGRYDKAIDYYSYTLKLNPQNVSAYNDLGVLLMNLKNYKKALEYFEKALSIDKNALKPQLNYQLCRQLMSEEKKGKQ